VREARQGESCGYWEPETPSYRVAYTSTAIQSFENNLHKPFGDPAKDPYVDCVRRGLNYILSMARPVEIPPEDPYGGDTNGNGIGIACCDRETGGGDEIYEIGIAMMAIVSSDTPGRRAVTGPDRVIGSTYQEILQDMADYCAWAQNDANSVDPDIQGIYLYDLSTSTQRHISTGSKVSPDVSGDKIVWEDDLYEGVHVYDLTTNTETLINSFGEKPAISGNKIVWEDERNDNVDIYMYDLTTKTEQQITADPADQEEPAISGDKIVWEDERNDNVDILIRRSRKGQPSLAIRLSGWISEMATGIYTCMIWILARSNKSALTQRIRLFQPSLATRLSGWIPGMVTGTSTCMIWIPEWKCQSVLLREIRAFQPSLAIRLSGWITGMATGIYTCTIWTLVRRHQSALIRRIKKTQPSPAIKSSGRFMKGILTVLVAGDMNQTIKTATTQSPNGLSWVWSQQRRNGA
jgi:beta propeller repeat protein